MTDKLKPCPASDAARRDMPSPNDQEVGITDESSQDDASGKVIQLNLGSQSRNSARDYVEVSVPDSVKTFLMVTPTAQLDKLAIDNERMFEARYGFRPGKAARKQVIALQHQYDLTDTEVISLRRSGQLTVRPKDQTVRVASDPVVPVAGGIYLFLITALCVSWVIDILLVKGQEDRKALSIVVIGGLWTGVIWYTSTRMIGPWQMIKQRIRHLRASPQDRANADAP